MSSLLDFLSRIISDFRRFSIGNFSGLIVVSEFGVRNSGSEEDSVNELEVHLIVNCFMEEIG